MLDFHKFKPLYFAAHEHQRFFDIFIKYKFYEHKKLQNIFFSLALFFKRTPSYNRCMSDYLSNIASNLIKEKADYESWRYIFEPSISLGLHFMATISILSSQDDRKQLFDNIAQHPVYQNILPIYENFVKNPNIDSINQISKICFEHIRNIRESGSFNDPWINFYDDMVNSQEYYEFTAQYYQYMDEHDIAYQDKLIFCLGSDRNIGDNYLFVNAIIHWSIKHNIKLIALLTPNQHKWIGFYCKDYFDHIIIRNSEKPVPYLFQTLYPAPNRVICVHGIFEVSPPYYLAMSKKRHFNHYTHDQLYKSDADVGAPVAISAIPDDIKNDNHILLQNKGLNPNNIILLSPNSNSDDFLSGSNIILKEFWDNLVLRLKQAGFTPIVNLSTPNEPHCINDIDAVNVPLTHIIDFVNNIGGFVGTRSGLMDLLCSSDNPKKYCLYPIEYVDWCNDLAPWYYMVHFKFDSIEQHIDDIMASLHGKSVESLENHHCYGYRIMPDYF